MEDRITVAKDLIVQSGKILDDAFRNLSRENASLKPDRTFFTSEDKSTEEFLVSSIRKIFPDDGFLAEEGTNIEGTSGYRWVIDPIDGTTNFVYRFPLYTTSIGLTKDNDLVGGLIYVPATQKLYVAEKGKGFTVNLDGSTKTWHVSNIQKPEDAMVIFSLAHKQNLQQLNINLYPIIFRNIRKLRILGSISFELTQVASGLADAVVNIDSTEWDVAAGVIMVREAGGVVIDFDGNDWTPRSKTLVAGNAEIAHNLVGLIHREFNMELLNNL